MPDWTREPTPTTQTGIHRRLHDMLWLLGYDVEDEVAVGRFSLDCYVREIHLGFEADGYAFHHSKKKPERDAARHAWIMQHAGIPILRVPEKRLSTAHDPQLMQEIHDFVRAHYASIDQRRSYAEQDLGGV